MTGCEGDDGAEPMARPRASTGPSWDPRIHARSRLTRLIPATITRRRLEHLYTVVIAVVKDQVQFLARTALTACSNRYLGLCPPAPP
jgi:hypothetical protein